MQVQTYLFFEGRCEEALAFYRETLGAEIGPILRFRDNPDDPDGRFAPPGAADKVMHSSFRIGETTLLASDGQCRADAPPRGVSLALQVADPAEAERLFQALAATGQIGMPMQKTFFARAFGMVTDRYDIGWMIMALN